MAEASLTHDLIVIGATAGGLSVAEGARRAGLANVLLLERGDSVPMPEILARNDLQIAYGEKVQSVDFDGDSDQVEIVTNRGVRRAHACMIAEREYSPEATSPIEVPPSERITVDNPPAAVKGADVMVIGATDHAVEMTAFLASAGANVVLAADGLEPVRLSPVAGEMLAKLEKDRQATVLYRSSPDAIGERNGFPTAYFADRRTPDLEFDHIVFATSRAPADLESLGVSDSAKSSDAVWMFRGQSEDVALQGAYGPDLWPAVAGARFPDAPIEPYGVRSWSRDTTLEPELAEHFYNATITVFEPTHSDLWRLRVRPDHGGTSHQPGQYATLGLGYWEPRVDGAADADLDNKWLKLIRRSYSISSAMFDDHGYLVDHTVGDELEFYIVLVHPSDENVPALTPRLALKKPGDRIFLGSKVAGRYTLAPVVDPARTCVFLSTGTGEAPHNAMVTQLLRKGHRGHIVSAVTVRKWADLGYRQEHEDLMQHYPNYHYLPLPTREDDVPKAYLQDVIRNDEFASRFGVELDPASTDFFLCGNPAMIGLPEGDPAEWPEVTGVVELLVDRGFKLDRRNDPGNIHFEEYW
ncbi:MAG: NAD(P)-binding domain-containing protein [Actinomycetota bacterium]